MLWISIASCRYENRQDYTTYIWCIHIKAVNDTAWPKTLSSVPDLYWAGSQQICRWSWQPLPASEDSTESGSIALDRPEGSRLSHGVASSDNPFRLPSPGFARSRDRPSSAVVIAFVAAGWTTNQVDNSTTQPELKESITAGVSLL